MQKSREGKIAPSMLLHGFFPQKRNKGMGYRVAMGMIMTDARRTT